MRKVALLMLATALSVGATAQDAGVKEAQSVATRTVKNEGGTTKGSWTKGGQFALNINQGGYDNWIPAADADWSVGGNLYVNLFANKTWAGKKSGKAKSFTNNLDINQGILNVHDERTDANTFNKLDDRIDFLSKYSVQLKDKLSFSTVANLRTQLYDTKVSGARKSGFMAPGIVTIAPGFQVQAHKDLSIFFSPLSARWVVISNGPYSLVTGIPSAKPFGVDPGRKVDFQPGGFVQALLDTKLGKEKKISWKSRLDLYSNYARKMENVDIYWDNFISFQVTKWISAGVNLTMVYDDDIRNFGWTRDRAALQYRHNIGIGIAKRF